MRKNKQLLWLSFGFLSLIFLFIDYEASKYDFELTEIFTHSFPFKLNVKWYEANYQIIEEDTQIGIMVADHYFPYDDDKNGVYVEKILKYCKVGEFLAVYVKTAGKTKVILIKNYDIDFSSPKFEFLEPKDFINQYGQLGGYVNLTSVPLFIGLWPITGSILLILLTVILFLIIKK